MITSFSSLLLPPWAEERVTDIQFYFVVLIDIFYYGHTFGVRVDGTSSRRFLRFLSLTAFQAEGGGIALTVHSEHILHYANWICKGASAT